MAGPKFISDHIAGMHNYFAQVSCGNKELHRSVLQQIQVFNCVIGCTLEYDDENSATNVLNTLFKAAKTINGLILTKAMRLLTHEKKLVFSIEGESDFDTYTPIANADLLDNGSEESPSDIGRRERSFTLLQAKEIPYIPHLRAAVLESQARVRPVAEIVSRLLAMFAVCVYSEARASGESSSSARKYLYKIDELLSGQLESCLTPEETAYLAAKNPPEHEIAKFGWRYECCYILLWVLGVYRDLAYPDQICDVPDMAKRIMELNHAEDLLINAAPRTAGEILDAADLILRYDWACVNARVHQQAAPAHLNGEVVVEWHYAFNWLIGANEYADWDHIVTNT